MQANTWPKYVTVVLNGQELDYINEALEMLANYHHIKLADNISERLVTAWNDAEPLPPARQIQVEAHRKRKGKVYGS